MTLSRLNAELMTCRRCPRLVAWREEVAKTKRRAYREWEYWGKPVPGFGDPRGRVLVVGLAPGAHGSNRTGRMFTGDASGDFLYSALYRAGFANQPHSHDRKDGLVLKDLYITAVCRCAPPMNRPAPQEMANCLPFLSREIKIIKPRVFVALGRVAFDSLLRFSPVNREDHPFRHGAVYPYAGGSWLVCSFHPSRQNTQTGRLTIDMFDLVWKTVRKLVQ